MHLASQHKSKNDDHDKNIKNKVCEVCGSRFTYQKNLNRLMKNCHQVDCKKLSSIMCPLCNSAFQTHIILGKHLTEAHEIVLDAGDIELDSTEGAYYTYSLNII